MEALIQRDLNRLPASTNNNHLYDFKWNILSNDFRLYMINNPHQDLWTLKNKYLIFDAFLPEIFSWTVFISLLEGISLVELDPSERTMAVAIPDGSTKNVRPFLLHLDLKLNNVFLDYSKPEEERQNAWDNYPVIRIGDFGLARYTHAKDEASPVPMLKWRCTEYWKRKSFPSHTYSYFL